MQIVQSNPEPFDLVLSDIIMPRMNGRALVAALRRADPAQKILLMSGYDDSPEDKVEQKPKPSSNRSARTTFCAVCAKCWMRAKTEAQSRERGS